MNDRPEATGALEGTAQVLTALRRLRAQARGLLVTRKLSVLLGAALGVAAVGAVLDYAVLMPQWLRILLWLGGVTAVAWAAQKFVWPAWRFNPELQEVALRLEKSEEGRRAGLEGVLTSGLELAESGGSPASEPGRWMASRVVAQAIAAFPQVRPSAILAPAQTRLRLVMLGAMLVGLTGLWATQPTLTTIGAMRILAPWTPTSWPKRTGVADATNIRVHPAGTALLLRAALTQTDLPSGKTTVAVRYRILDGGTPGPTRRLLMTGQGKPIAVVAADGGPGESGERYDRLIEPSGIAPAPESDDEQTRELEYWFETADDATRPARIRLVRPPSVIGATGEVTPPAYAGAATGAGIVSGTIDMGPGNDDRAVLGPVLAGSQVRLTIHLNKPVPGPAGRDPESLANFALRTLGSADLGSAVVPSAEGKDTDAVVLRFSAADSLRLPVIVSDDFGLTNSDEAVYTVDVVKDRPPTAAVIQPGEDEAVLATAEIGVQGEGRDDAGLRWVTLERQRARPPPGSIGAAPEAMGSPVEFARAEAGEAPVLQARASATLDLRAAEAGLIAGDEVWITALAQDIYSVGNESHEAVRSAVRKLRIISEDQFVEQIRGSLAQVRETAKVLDGEQAQLSRTLTESGATPEARSRQAGLTDRLGSQTRAVQDLIDRAGRNNLPDEALKALLAEAQRLAADAAKASGGASESMNGPEQSLPEPQLQEAQKEQGKVRDDLGRLIELLDRGQDSWLTKRDLQRLLEDQKALAEQTKKATDATLGKSPESLTTQEQANLQAIADRQRELADRAEQAIDQLGKKSQELAQKDAVGADAMQQAADRGQRENVPHKMDEAADNAQQNKGQQAQDSQQQAVESLQEMLQDLENAAKNRDEALRRVLASLVDTLRGLVRRQTDELAALGQAGASGPFTGLDAGMIRLNTNTLAASAETREKGMAELAPIADLIDRAAEGQTKAIGALRAVPVSVPDAAAGEDTSLARLREALVEAEKQKKDADQRENERKRRELKEAYRVILESQVALRDETATYIDKALNRKQTVGVRRLGERQTMIRKDLSELRDKTTDLADAGVFQFAHRRLDEVTGAAAAKLGDGIADKAAARFQDSAVRTLQALLASLEDPKQKDEFRNNDSQGDGGGGQGGSGQPEPMIPDMAELLLLRSLQQEAADLTRSIDETGSASPDEVQSIGRMQRDLAEQGKQLIDKLKGEGEPNVKTPEPAPPEPPSPEPKPEGEKP